MKEILKSVIALCFVLLISMCGTPEAREEDCPKPAEVPEWIKWDCDKDKAWDEGRIYFNEDSSSFGYGSGKIDSTEVNLDIENFQIK